MKAILTVLLMVGAIGCGSSQSAFDVADASTTEVDTGTTTATTLGATTDVTLTDKGTEADSGPLATELATVDTGSVTDTGPAATSTTDTGSVDTGPASTATATADTDLRPDCTYTCVQVGTCLSNGGKYEYAYACPVQQMCCDFTAPATDTGTGSAATTDTGPATTTDTGTGVAYTCPYTCTAVGACAGDIATDYSCPRGTPECCVPTVIDTGTGSAVDTGTGSAVDTGTVDTAYDTDLTCGPKFCTGHGICEYINPPPKAVTKCVCNEGYVGSACTQCDTGYDSDTSGNCNFHDTSHDGTEWLCLPDTCNGHGVCNLEDYIPTCTCYTAQGYTGAYCDQCMTGYKDDGAGGCMINPAATCHPNSCSYNGSCTPAYGNGDATCTCYAFYTGTTCNECYSWITPDSMGGCNTQEVYESGAQVYWLQCPVGSAWMGGTDCSMHPNTEVSFGVAQTACPPGYRLPTVFEVSMLMRNTAGTGCSADVMAGLNGQCAACTGGEPNACASMFGYQDKLSYWMNNAHYIFFNTGDVQSRPDIARVRCVRTPAS